MKQILTLLVSLSMLVCLLPVQAAAEVVPEETTSVVTEEIGQTQAAEETTVPETQVEEETMVPETQQETVPVETDVPAQTETGEVLPVEEISELETAYLEGMDLTNEELFSAYVEREFYGTGDIGMFSVGAESAGAKLTGDEAKAYNALVPFIKQIAAGQRSSARISMGSSGNVDVTVDFEGTYAEFDRKSVVLALRSDYPYEMYWFDFVTGFWNQYPSSGRMTRYTISFTVAAPFRGSDDYTADTTKTAATSAAVYNAKAIVNKYAGESDYGKLTGFRDEICALVEYDDYAADNNTFTTNSGPWQMIYVFDGNYATNVVCEGYSKAFQYLCDMSGLTCYSVHGYVPGGHMWNIVTLEDKNYLVDVTWIDSGWECQFLAGGKGSVSQGYTFYHPYGSSAHYSYRSNMLPLWGQEVLTLASESYDPNDHVHTTKVVAPTCTEKGYTELSCLCGYGYRENYTAAKGHRYQNAWDTVCDTCGQVREIETTPMYRLYNPNSGEHFYTGSVTERDDLVWAGWSYEGIGWYAPTEGGDPVYRLYNPNNGDHHYTMSATERDNVVKAGWIYEGVCWNSAPAKIGIPLYRLYNPNADCGSHHYTGSTVERENLVKVGWIYEGIGWFGLAN